MRIIELLENKKFNESDFVKVVDDTGKKELNYDLPDDLIFFMNNNDEAYRRHFYPAISKCIDRKELNKKTKPIFFEKAIKECFKMYAKEYPIRELPDTLDENVLSEICEKIHEEVCQHINDGKYK